MAFTTETKNGYVDGEHFANHGQTFPIFARVKNGQLYAVARVDTPGAEFGKVVFLSVEWLKNAPFSAKKSDADFFSDRPNGSPDTSEPGASFVLTGITTDQAFKFPVAGAPTTTVLPVVVDPVTLIGINPTPPAKEPAKTPIPVATATTQGATEPAEFEPAGSGMGMTAKLLIGVAIAAVLGVVLYLVTKKK